MKTHSIVSSSLSASALEEFQAIHCWLSVWNSKLLYQIAFRDLIVVIISPYTIIIFCMTQYPSMVLLIQCRIFSRSPALLSSHLRVGKMCEIWNGVISGSMITNITRVKMGQKSPAFLTLMVLFWWGSCLSLHERGESWQINSSLSKVTKSNSE